MAGFLNYDSGVYTSARDDGYGRPVTDVHIRGTKLAQQFTETHTVDGKLTFSKNIEAIGIYNRDENNDGVFKVNGINIYVPSNEYVEFAVGGAPSNIVEVSGSTKYIVSRFE